MVDSKCMVMRSNVIIVMLCERNSVWRNAEEKGLQVYFLSTDDQSVVNVHKLSIG